tara:strand:+ start:10102 stop:10677 length:576 start_codon:yes stop_codon:yes gene_type:complete
MSRFECLNNNWQTKKPRNERNQKNEKHYNKNNRDYNKKEKRVPVNNVKKEINFLDEKLFPSLVKSEGVKENTLKNYIGIVNDEIETEKIEERVPPGWTMIYKKDNKIIMEKGNSIYNPYNKELQEENERYMIANEILDNRYYERLELNEILGDISPYLNMDKQYEYDTRDDEIVDDNDVSDSEYENEEDFY